MIPGHAQGDGGKETEKSLLQKTGNAKAKEGEDEKEKSRLHAAKSQTAVKKKKFRPRHTEKKFDLIFFLSGFCHWLINVLIGYRRSIIM